MENGHALPSSEIGDTKPVVCYRGYEAALAALTCSQADSEGRKWRDAANGAVTEVVCTQREAFCAAYTPAHAAALPAGKVRRLQLAEARSGEERKVL